MKKKFLSVLLIVAVLIGMAGVSGTQTESGEQKADKEQKQQENEQTAETKVEIPPENEEEQKGWIGVILNGDETEAYTLAHIDGIRAAAENVSLPEQDIIWNTHLIRVKCKGCKWSSVCCRTCGLKVDSFTQKYDSVIQARSNRQRLNFLHCVICRHCRQYGFRNFNFSVIFFDGNIPSRKYLRKFWQFLD